MPTPTAWTSVTGQGELDWGEWTEVQVVSLFTVLDPTAKANFVPGNQPRQIVRAGGLGVGQYGDPDPFSSTAILGVSFWWWLEWEYTEIRLPPSDFQSFSASLWRLRPGVTLYYKINGV